MRTVTPCSAGLPRRRLQPRAKAAGRPTRSVRLDGRPCADRVGRPGSRRSVPSPDGERPRERPLGQVKGPRSRTGISPSRSSPQPFRSHRGLARSYKRSPDEHRHRPEVAGVLDMRTCRRSCLAHLRRPLCPSRSAATGRGRPGSLHPVQPPGPGSVTRQRAEPTRVAGRTDR
jgi:hypothetical protein